MMYAKVAQKRINKSNNKSNNKFDKKLMIQFVN